MVSLLSPAPAVVQALCSGLSGVPPALMSSGTSECDLIWNGMGSLQMQFVKRRSSGSRPGPQYNSDLETQPPWEKALRMEAERGETCL